LPIFASLQNVSITKKEKKRKKEKNEIAKNLTKQTFLNLL
jgi:hypothetical protein